MENGERLLNLELINHKIPVQPSCRYENYFL